MAYTEILYEKHGHVGVITLNRPDARNALTYTTYAELEDAVRTTDARCLVITGADPAFCSGDDVKQIMAGAGERVSQRAASRAAPHAGGRRDPQVRRPGRRRRQRRGRRLGHGARRDGRHPRSRPRRRSSASCSSSAGCAVTSPASDGSRPLVGRERAAELLFTGRIIDANEAKEIGLVSRVVPHDRAAAGGDRAGRHDRVQPAARRREAEGGPAQGARSRLGRARHVGQHEPRSSSS